VESFGWFRHGSSIHVLMEYMPLGDLDKYLRDTPMPISEARDITHQIVGGLNAMHSCKFVHRDLKPQVSVGVGFRSEYAGGISTDSPCV
jgi:serine/threonine protein kinase